MSIELTEDDLRGLSENERAALLESMEGDTDGDIAEAFGKTGRAAAPAAPSDDGEIIDTDEDDEAAAAAATATETAVDKQKPGGEDATPPDADAKKPEPEPEEDPVVVPSPPVTPNDIEERRNTLNTREDESMQRLLDGEITVEEHAKVKAEVRQGLDELLLAQATDKATEAVERQQMMREYTADLGATIKMGKAAGLDYGEKTDTGKEFNRLVVMFSNELLSQGVSDRPGNLANSREALSQAHQLMMLRHGKSAAAPTPAAEPKPAAKARPPVDRSTLPPTLAGTPVAADNTVEGNKFAHLDAIENPAELERALARLTPAEQEEYLGM